MPLPIFSLMLVVFGLTTGEFVIAGILPVVAADLAVSVSAAGLLITAYALGMIIGGPVVTVLTGRMPRRRLVVALLVVSVTANLASALAPDYVTLLVFRLLAGSVVATFFAVAIASTVAMSAAGKQASSVAKVTLGLNLGIVLGTPLGTFIGQQAGWRATFVAVAALIVLATVLVLRFVPRMPAATTGSLTAELRVLGERNVQLAIALTALGNLGVVTVFSFIAPLLTEVSGFAAAAVPVLLLVYGAGAVLGNVLGGRLADRALLPSIAWLLVVLAATLLAAWLLSDVRPLVPVLTFLIGLLAFAIIPGMQTTVLVSAGRAPTLAVAVNASGFQLAAACAGWLGGMVIDSGLGAAAIYPVSAALTMLGLLIAVLLLRRGRRAARSTAAP